MKTLAKNAFFSAVVLSALMLNSCAKEECREKRIGGCMHTEEYNPVCGCNGKTYGNASEAACNSIKDFKPGPCEGIGS
jgi:hypothetical protein